MCLDPELIVGRQLAALEVSRDVLEVLEHLENNGHVAGVSGRFICDGNGSLGRHIRDLPFRHLIHCSGVAFRCRHELNIRSGSVGRVLGCYGPFTRNDIRDDQLLGLIGHVSEGLVDGPHLLCDVAFYHGVVHRCAANFPVVDGQGNIPCEVGGCQLADHVNGASCDANAVIELVYGAGRKGGVLRGHSKRILDGCEDPRKWIPDDPCLVDDRSADLGQKTVDLCHILKDRLVEDVTQCDGRLIVRRGRCSAFDSLTRIGCESCVCDTWHIINIT